ncbi:hypothetical protein JCM10450v2_006066 [Rhodotorula kratochvilovae]
MTPPAPPFLRTNSSPTIPTTQPSAPTAQLDVAQSLLHALPLPHLVFDSFLRLNSLNDAARSVFGITSGHGGPGQGGGDFPPGGADVFLCVTGEMQARAAGATSPLGADKIRAELERLADKQEECASSAGAGAADWAWGEGDKMELKSGKVPGLRWSAEVKVTRFFPPRFGDEDDRPRRPADDADVHEYDEEMPDWLNQGVPSRRGSVVPQARSSAWFSVLLLRPWREPAPPTHGSHDRIFSHRRSFSLDTPLAASSASPFSSGYTPTVPTFPHNATSFPSTAPPLPPAVPLPPSGERSAPSSPSLTNPAMFRRKDSYSLADRTPTLGSSFTNPFGLSAIAQRRGSASLVVSASATPQLGGAPAGGSWEFAQPFGATSEEDEVEAAERVEDAPVSLLERRRSSLSGAPTNPSEWPEVAPVRSASPSKSGLRIPNSTLAAARAITPKAAANLQLGGAGSGGSSSGSGSIGSAGSAGSLLSSATTAATSPSRRGSTASMTATLLPEALKGMGISVSSAGIHLSQSSPLVVPASEPSAPATPSVSTFPMAGLSSPATPGGGVTPTAQHPTSTPLQLPLPRLRAPHPLSMSRSSPSTASSGSSASSPSHFPLPSPRPTALPPIPARPPQLKPDPPALLKFAALAHLPNTGIILSDPELASGYVNALARELLMGVPSTDGLGEQNHGEWWLQGQWSVEDELWSSASGATHASSASSQAFFSPSSDIRANPFDAKDLTFQSIIASGEATNVDAGKGTAGSSIRIGRASETNRYRTTVAGILARSLVSDERRKAALGKGGPPSGSSGSGSDIAAARGFSMYGALRSPGGMSATSSGSGSTTATNPTFVAAGGIAGQNRKPYKVFDESFSQRIIDPFEPLLEMSARRGEQPPQVDPDGDDDEEILAGQVANGMIVGVEVEVWDAPAHSSASSPAAANPLKQDSFTTSASLQMLGQRKKRVRRRIIEVSSMPVFAPSADGKKQHLGGILVLRDVTNERKRSATVEGRVPKKKSAAEGYYKQILDAIPQLIWRTTPMGSHNYFNASWYEYTGLEPEQSLGLGWQSPFHEDDMPVCLKAWSHSLATGEPYAVEYRCRRHDGVWRWMLGRARPYRDADGNIQGWFGTCTDFHELYNMREQLRRTLQQNAAVVQGAGCLLLAVDAKQRISFMEGTHKDQMLANVNVVGPIEGQDLLALKPEPDFYAAYKGVISGEISHGTTEWTSAQGQSFRCLLTPLTESRNGVTSIIGCIIVAHDITDLVRTQARLQQAYEERAELQASETAATEASRLKSEFLAHMSHELRTPISQLLGLGELLLAEQLSDSQRTLASQILRSGDVLLEMIGQDMGKVEAGKLDLENRAFNLNDLSADARLFSTAARKKGLEFIDEVDEFQAQVIGDMPRLRQVLNNLLANATKFTRSGWIKFSAKNVAEDDESVTVRWVVQDTGVGIRKEAISTLFKPFHQADVSTSRLFGGAGLGLSISKNLIELMGGSINLESEYGVGSKMTVELKLPKVPEELVEQVTPITPNPAETPRKDSVWLLVVDDNELNRVIISKLLVKMGFKVDSVSNGYDALDAVAGKAYNLVILDNQMDGIDGLETMIRMRRSSIPRVANIKVIALTASALKGDQEKFLSNGADGYLSKPVRSNVLESTILRVLQPAALGRRTSTTSNGTSGTPSVESASRSGFDFGTFNPEAPPVNEDLVAPLRKRPSHPSYGEGSL